MADVTESSTWEDGIYQLEVSDPVLGGAGGVSNRQAKELANRTLYLKDTLEGFQAAEAITDEDLQDQIDAIVDSGFSFRAILTKQSPYTVIPDDIGKLIRGAYFVGDGDFAQFTIPAADAVGDGKTLAFINVITENSTRVPIIRAGADTIWVNGISYTTLYLRPGDFVVLVSNTSLNRWEAIVYSQKNGAVPVGTIIAFAADAAPAGYLPCSGQTISQGTYADLYALIGETYNTGGEVGFVFRLPEMRAEFIRGWDNSRGIDVDRALGSYQAEEVGPHQHTLASNTDAQSGGSLQRLGGPTNTFQVNENPGAENRPRNIALLYCIKF